MKPRIRLVAAAAALLTLTAMIRAEAGQATGADAGTLLAGVLK